MMNERIVVVIPYYNTGDYLYRCLESVQQQTRLPDAVVLIDDVSTDGSGGIAYTWKENKIKEKTTMHIYLVTNREKHYQVKNYFGDSAVWNDSEIIVLLDGDDSFSDDEVLERIENEYKDPSVWMTYGQFQYPDGRHGFAKEVDWSQSVRSQPFTATHLRTFRAWLFKLITWDDLQMDGKWPEMTGDQFFMFPMLEMCGPEHAKFLPYVNYTYNSDNPLNDHKTNLDLQLATSKYVRSLPPYERIGQ